MKYSTIAEVYDLGPFITKVVLDVEQELTDCSIDKETFHVQVVRKDKTTGDIIQISKFWGSKDRYPSEGERKIEGAYISDREGRHSNSGSFITLELEVDPRISLGSTITFNNFFNEHVNCEYSISQTKPIVCGNINLSNMFFSVLDQEQTLLADEFITGTSTYQELSLSYAVYQPQSNGEKRPLLIWLHGAGEGGNDPIIAISGNKVVNLITEDIQQYFGRSYVLAPQAPTMWMDDGTGRYNTNGSSMYVEAVKNVIDEFIINHNDVDQSRIYIGGCSNGGFMTMKMIIEYPQLFAAAYPICEALSDEFITDEDISKIKNIPIWFTHSSNDPIVNVDRHPLATYQRLINAGATEVHFSCFSSVTDQTGNYFNEDGTPYEYNGHFSWIPALNNECCNDYNKKPVVLYGRKVTLFEWISMQKRQDSL